MATLVSDHVRRRRKACIAAVETFHPVPANNNGGPKSRFVNRAASLISGAGLAQHQKDPSHGGYFGTISSTARSWFLSLDWKLLATIGAQRVSPPALALATNIGPQNGLRGGNTVEEVVVINFPNSSGVVRGKVPQSLAG